MSDKSEIVRHPAAEHGIYVQDVMARPIAAIPPVAPGEQEISPREVWAAVRRNRWLILVCVAASLALAAYLTSRATPIYRAATTLKVDVRDGGLTGIFPSSGEGSELGTEAEVLQSRTLAESAATALALQFRLQEPRRVSRDMLFDSIVVARDVGPASYRLERQADGRFAVLADSAPAPVATVAPGERLRVAGLAVRLLPAAAQYGTIGFDVLTIDQATRSVLGALTVLQAGRDVNILNVMFEDADPGLAWRVPNTIADRYLARRRQVAQTEAQSTAEFLREQLDTVSGQLAVAEDALRDYRQRTRVIDPQGEATSQVQRLIAMQSERATLESERAALGKLLAEVDAKAARQGPEEGTPYRELLAFPSLLRSQIAAGLLQSLSEVEQQRAVLLARRTTNDPDVQVLTARVKELETQLRSVVVTYLQGLGNQVATIDGTLEQFGQQLGGLPQRELEVARLARKPKVLDEISTLLERRLKEAEIAQAAGDPSVQVLDPAVPPNGPYKPNRTTNLLAGLLGGLLLGGVAAFLREYRDRTVHTRREIEIATGLPVLGLIPTIGGRRWSMNRIPLITEARKRRASHATVAPAAPRTHTASQSAGAPPGGLRPTYTFLGPAPAAAPEPGAAPEPPPQAEVVPPPAPLTTLSLTQAGSAVAEAYGVLQTNIAFSFQDRSVRTVVLTSALPGEGKTTNAVNLSITLTRRGWRVLLIDADLRRGSVHRALDAPREPGLTEVLRGALPFARACRSVDIEGHVLHYLSTGSAVPSPTGLLDSDAMRGLVARLRDDYDLIIIDSPPANIVTDAAVLSAMADGVVLVARVGVTEAGAIGTALRHLRHVRAPVIGVVLNDIDFKRDADYDPSYRYYDYGQYVSSTSA